MLKFVTLIQFQFFCMIAFAIASETLSEDELCSEFATATTFEATPKPEPYMEFAHALSSPSTDDDDDSQSDLSVTLQSFVNASPSLSSYTTAKETPENPRKLQLPQTAKRHLTLRILVADDNEFNRRVMHSILTKLGHSVVLVTSGRKAVEAIEQYIELPFHVFFSDVEMEDMDGPQAAKAIRDLQKISILHAEVCKLPIIGVTANEHKVKECLDNGMNEVLLKPINTGILSKALESYFARTAQKE